MNQYPCGWIFSYFPDENQASHCCHDINRTKSSISALCSGRFVQMSDQHNGTSSLLCNHSQFSEHRTHFICPIHIHIRSNKGLYRINNYKPHMILPDCLFNSIIRQDCSYSQSLRKCFPMSQSHHLRIPDAYPKSGLFLNICFREYLKYQSNVSVFAMNGSHQQKQQYL